MDGRSGTLKVFIADDADDGPSAVRACRESTIDIALLDVRMRGGGVEAAVQIATLSPRTRVVMLTTFDEDALSAALRCGAVGFLLKDTGPDELLGAVRAAHLGQQVLAPRVTRRLIERHLVAPGSRTAASARLRSLAPVETKVLAAVAEGLSNAEVGLRLYLGTGTVKTHLSRVLTTLESDNPV